eukprot:COSAG04_NODE_2578_length_3902_cov_3.615830_4_plen_78_part_00
MVSVANLKVSPFQERNHVHDYVRTSCLACEIGRVDIFEPRDRTKLRPIASKIASKTASKIASNCVPSQHPQVSSDIF